MRTQIIININKFQNFRHAAVKFIKKKLKVVDWKLMRILVQ